MNSNEPANAGQLGCVPANSHQSDDPLAAGECHLATTVPGRRQFLGYASASIVAAAVGTDAAHAQQGDATSPITQGSDRLRGKTAVITGAARGIGRAIAVAYAAEGADVMGIDIAGPVSRVSEAEPAKRQDLEETGRLVTRYGRKFLPFIADVRDMTAMRNAAAQAQQAFGHIDIVVPNAAIQTMKPLLEMNDQEWRDIIDVNLSGYANTIRAFGPYLVQRNAGRIIMIASRQGRQGWKNGSSYCSSKWGVIGLMKSVSLELAPHKITVNCIEPGLVDTPLTRNPTRLAGAMKEIEHTEQAPEHFSIEQVEQGLSKQSPMHLPWLQPKDIAPVAVFLASDEAYLVSGATYDVTAGDSAHYTA